MDEGNTDDRRPFMAKRQEFSAAWMLLLVTVALGVAFAGFRAWSWWQGTVHARGSTGAPYSAAARPAPPMPAEKRNVISAPPVQPGTDASGVVKCVAQGITTYAASAADCPPGAHIAPVAVDPKLNLADGLQDAPAVIRAAPSAAGLGPAGRITDAAEPPANRQALCRAYEEEIKAIDARARQPLPGQEQDRLAALRKKARDEQFRLRC